MTTKYETVDRHAETLKAEGIKTSVPTLKRWSNHPVNPLPHIKLKGKNYYTLDLTLPWIEGHKVGPRPEPRRRGRPPRAA
jgi:hypothetical protein